MPHAFAYTDPPDTKLSLSLSLSSSQHTPRTSHEYRYLHFSAWLKLPGDRSSLNRERLVIVVI